MTTGEQLPAEATPMRMCVGCRVSRAQDRLLRLQLAGSRVVPAITRRGRQGRSAYLCPRRDCLERAIKRRVFTRVFSSRQTARAVEQLDPAAGELLWASAIEQLRREIDMIDRTDATDRTGRLSSRPGGLPSRPDGLPSRPGGLPSRPDLLGRPHTHLRRLGLERLLFELSSPPTPDRRPASNGQGGSPTHG